MTRVMIAIVVAIAAVLVTWLIMFWQLVHADETPGWARHLIEAAANS